MNDPVVITLEAVGTKQFPRWRIATRDSRYWDGKDWTAKRNAALLYADPGVAAKDADEILRLQYADQPCIRRITVPLLIEVRSDQQIDVEALKTWIKKAATLYVDYRQHGNGPENSLVLLSINWEEIR